jgi:hypothetical protein
MNTGTINGPLTLDAMRTTKTNSSSGTRIIVLK